MCLFYILSFGIKYWHKYYNDSVIKSYVLDINECLVYNEPCHPDATCIDELGSYKCTCKEGYSGDGKTSCSGELHMRKKYYVVSYICNIF